MSNEFDWKKFQFITEVQTALINNAVNLSLDDDAIENRHTFSAIATLINMQEAFHAADKIPKEMDAHQAACEFVEYTCENLQKNSQEVPHWFARY